MTIAIIIITIIVQLSLLSLIAYQRKTINNINNLVHIQQAELYSRNNAVDAMTIYCLSHIKLSYLNDEDYKVVAECDRLIKGVIEKNPKLSSFVKQ
jgi:hypothetical protein